MGCGTSSHPPKRETRAQSQVTVAAQQRAEAAYRRQRMAQEREQTAVLRAEMEVERARLLKEMNGGSRRPSYCIELENLKEEAPDEVQKELENCLNDYSVKANNTKNARNSLSNGYSRSARIMKSESRGENDDHQSQEQQENDENGNTETTKSTGDCNDQEAYLAEKNNFLEIIRKRSAQASPSNVYVEENEQSRGNEDTRENEQTRENEHIGEYEQARENEHTREYSGNDDETSEPHVGVVDGSRESRTENETVLIAENADAGQDHSAEKTANNCNDVSTIVNEDSSVTHEDLTTNDENMGIKMESNSEGSDQVQDITNNVNTDGRDNEPVKMADDSENILNFTAKESNKENEQQGGIEHGGNVDVSSEHSRIVENVSIAQDLPSLQKEHGDAVVDQSNGHQEMTS